MSDTPPLNPGWLKRQCDFAEAATNKWPEWMRDEAGIRPLESKQMSEIDRPDLDAIEARAGGVLEGPWKVGPYATDIYAPERLTGFGGDVKIFDIRAWGYFTGRGHGALKLSDEEGEARQRALGEFVARARDDVPALVAYCRRLEQERGTAKERIAELERENLRLQIDRDRYKADAGGFE